MQLQTNLMLIKQVLTTFWQVTGQFLPVLINLLLFVGFFLSSILKLPWLSETYMDYKQYVHGHLLNFVMYNAPALTIIFVCVQEVLELKVKDFQVLLYQDSFANLCQHVVCALMKVSLHSLLLFFQPHFSLLSKKSILWYNIHLCILKNKHDCSILIKI